MHKKPMNQPKRTVAETRAYQALARAARRVRQLEQQRRAKRRSAHRAEVHHAE